MTLALRSTVLAVVFVLALAASALGQALPGRPDLPPPDPSPPPVSSPPRAPTPAAPTPAAPRVDPGPSAADLQAQRQAAAAAAAAEKRRLAAIRRKQEAIRRRQEAIRKAKRERAREFRDLQRTYDSVLAVGGEVTATSRTLDGFAVSSAVAVSEGSAAEPAGNSRNGRALMVVLLLASGISAALIVLPLGLRATLSRREGELATDDRGVGSYVAERIPLLEHRRIELAGVSVACLLVACLILVGLI